MLCHTQQTKTNKKQIKRPQQNMLNQVMSHTTNKKQTKRPQQNMLNQLMSHTTNKKTKNKQKGLNRAC
jgi:hypothetical protein